jgi:KaiC/GvpD/RAD55 family RecA-like ATPase
MLMPVEIFCCYARKDQSLLNDLKSHLKPLQRQGRIILWADTDIDAGMIWENEIDKHLDTAQIILLLVSPDFIDSEYCYGKEMKRAMARYEAGEAQVVPVILRPVLWENTPFGKLQALPTGARPIISSLWHNRDEAFYDVAFGIQKVIREFRQEEEPQESEQPDYVQAKAVPTGFEDLDRLTGGLQPSDLIVVEGPSASGKTNLALSIALHAAIVQGFSVGIFSLETNEVRLVNRLISLYTSIDLQRLNAQTLGYDEWEIAGSAMHALSEHIWIDDRPGFAISQLRARAQEMMRKGKVDLIILDYVNLIPTENSYRGQDYREISQSLKVIARELNVPLLALAQISRKVRNFGEGPRVLDAQDNSIENDADVVMYIYREDMREQDTMRHNIADIIVTKHRNGICDEISLYCETSTGRFRDLMRNPAPES